MSDHMEILLQRRACLDGDRSGHTENCADLRFASRTCCIRRLCIFPLEKGLY